jgi:hypothetical protein
MTPYETASKVYTPEVQLNFTVDEARELYEALRQLVSLTQLEHDIKLQTIVFNQLHEAGIV